VVVIFIICVVGLLFLYMLFLLCLDPLMTRRPMAYTEQHNEQPEEVSMVSRKPPLPQICVKKTSLCTH